jgi:hypothetical protein
MLAAQALCGVAVGWALYENGQMPIGEAKLVMAAIVMGPLVLSIVWLRLLKGSIYEQSNGSYRQIWCTAA